MNEKPFHLPMGFGEALGRLSRVPKGVSSTQVLDYTGKSGKNDASVEKPKRTTKLRKASRKNG